MKKSSYLFQDDMLQFYYNQVIEHFKMKILVNELLHLLPWNLPGGTQEHY
jgi:hypothetical protein